MGLFSTKTGELIVKFYGTPDNPNGDEVSVIYQTANSEPASVAADFWKYTGKVLYNLGNDPPALMLRSRVISIIKEGITKTANVLQGDNYKLRLVSDKEVFTKKCTATFFGKDQPKTGFSWGGELYYAPMSVFAFLQYLINWQSEEKLTEISSYLQAFLQFTVGQ